MYIVWKVNVNVSIKKLELQSISEINKKCFNSDASLLFLRLYDHKSDARVMSKKGGDTFKQEVELDQKGQGNLPTECVKKSRGRPKKKTVDSKQSDRRLLSLVCFLVSKERENFTMFHSPRPNGSASGNIEQNIHESELGETEETEATKKLTDRNLLLVIMTDLKKLSVDSEKVREENQIEIQKVREDILRISEDWQKEKACMYEKIQCLETKIQKENFNIKSTVLEQKINEMQKKLEMKIQPEAMTTQNATV